MATRKLLTNGNAFKRTDGRWGGTVLLVEDWLIFYNSSRLKNRKR